MNAFLLVLVVSSLLTSVASAQERKPLQVQVQRTDVAGRKGLRLRVVNDTDAPVSFQVYLEARTSRGWVLVDTDVLTPDPGVGMIRPLGAHRIHEAPDLQGAIAQYCMAEENAAFRLVAHYGASFKNLAQTSYSAVFNCVH